MKIPIHICSLALGLLAITALAPDAPAGKPAPALPPIVTPGTDSAPDASGKAPSDAVVLFDGKNLDAWESKSGEPAKWKLVEGDAMEITRTGDIRTKQKLGYGQYHVEFRTPPEVKGSGQGRGNSGVYLMGKNEIQVLDSYENTTYPNGQCGSIYGRHIPLVNASRKPGQWQSYDIIFAPPIVSPEGKLIHQGTYTVLHNGVLIHAHVEVDASGPKDTGAISLQDHGNPVRYRNIWYRPWGLPIKK